MSSPKADENVVAPDSVVAEEKESVSRENQHQQSLAVQSAVPSTNQTPKPSFVLPSNPEEILEIALSWNPYEQFKLPLPMEYLLPSFIGYSIQRQLETAYSVITDIDTKHYCCNFLNDYAVKLEIIHRRLSIHWSGTLQLGDHVPSHVKPFTEANLNILMQHMDFYWLKHLLENTKQGITLVKEQFHAFLNKLCTDDVSIDDPALVQMLEQIKTKLISIDLVHEGSMKLVDEIETHVKGVEDMKKNIQIAIDNIRAVRNATLGECSFKPLKTTQDLSNFNDRLGSDEKFFDAFVTYIESKIHSEDVKGRLDEAFDLIFDDSLAAQLVWSDTSESDAEDEDEQDKENKFMP